MKLSKNETSAVVTKPQSAITPVELPKEKQDQLELVILHHEEDLLWTSHIDPKILACVTVYHKGNPDKTAIDYKCTLQESKSIPFYWNLLENVGRESHSIYVHCLYMSGRDLPKDTGLPNRNTLFVQGGMDANDYHLKANHLFPISEWYKYADRTRAYICSHPGEIWNKPGFIEHHSKWAEEKKNGKMRATSVTMAEFHIHILKRPFPLHHGLFTSFGNYFAVSNQRIQQHSIQLYYRLVDVLKSHVNPEEGHYAEWLSRTIFGGTDIKDYKTTDRPEIFVPIQN